MSGASMVEMATVPLERSGERQMVWPAPTMFQNLQVGGHGGGMAASCSRPCELETICEIWEEPCWGVARCFGDPSASGMVWNGAAGSLWRRMVPFGGESWSRPRKWVAERGTESERFGEHLLLLSLYQVRLDRVWMSSWYSAGYGWRIMVCSENGRRSGSWDNRSEDEWFCLKCRMVPWRPGAIFHFETGKC